MKRLFLLSAVMMALHCSGKTGRANITEVYTQPNQPAHGQVITIVVSGLEGSHPVLITNSDFQMQGNSLELNIFLSVGYYGLITPWSHSEIIGSLPAAEYSLTVNAHYSGAYTGTDTYSISFTVLPTNSNSVVEDGIEYYVQTDKAVYTLGEEVQMLYKVTNLRDEDVTFSALPSPPWNFWVQVDGNDIFRAVNRWWGMPTQFTLGPDESAEFPDVNSPYIWNMEDRDGNIVNPGEYTVVGGLYNGLGDYEHTKVGVGIRIISEVVAADVELQPDTLNLKSKGKWISCKIWLPEDYNVADVNSETIFLEDEIPAEWVWFNEGQNVVTAKFRRSDVTDIIQPGLVELTVTGELTNGTQFEGIDTIKVIDKPHGRLAR